MTLLVNRTTNRSIPRFLPEDGDLLARDGQARLFQELRHVVVVAAVTIGNGWVPTPARSGSAARDQFRPKVSLPPPEVGSPSRAHAR